MISSNNFVYSKAAAARILGVAASSIVSFQKWWRVCWVWVKGRRPIFISFDKFKQSFVKWRKEQSLGLCTAQIPKTNEWRVVNPNKGTTYSVMTWNDGLDCTCEDFKNQIAIIGKGCCKHCYAVLRSLHIYSLADYIEKHRHCE